jgi:hypothetical protein
MPNFQLNTKNVFLTYPKCNLPISDILASLYAKPHVVYVCVSSEVHADGEPHRHALVQFSQPLRTRNERMFDINGFHPNIQGARSPKATLQYVKKEGDFLERGTFVEAKAKGGEKEVVCAEEIKSTAQEMTYGDFLCWASEHNVHYAEKIWNAFAKKDISTLEDSDDYDPKFLDPAFLAMMKEELNNGICKEKTLILKGASGIGKTVVAKKIIDKPALFVSHVDQLKLFRVGYHKGIIFDDISFNHTPRENQIAITDYDNARAIHCRHTVATIPAGIMKIFTCNEAPLNLMDEAIARRVNVIECGHGQLNKYRNPLAKKLN